MVRTLGVSLDLLLAVSMGVDQKVLIKFHCGWMLDCLLGLISSSPLGLFYFRVLFSILFIWLLFLRFSLFSLFKDSFVTIWEHMMIMNENRTLVSFSFFLMFWCEANFSLLFYISFWFSVVSYILIDRVTSNLVSKPKLNPFPYVVFMIKLHGFEKRNPLPFYISFRFSIIS